MKSYSHCKLIFFAIVVSCLLSPGWANDARGSQDGRVLKGTVFESRLNDILEQAGVTCAIRQQGARNSLIVVDVHKGTAGFNAGVEEGDVVTSLTEGNGGFKLTFSRRQDLSGRAEIVNGKFREGGFSQQEFQG